ncbi:MAG: hypothetical protein IJB29_04245 [Mailhella sp.]|nr:hypothetical protein [Mailhella sp.]MBQ4615905.1 hypothetical protein [Mailhella sp.]
MNELLEQIFSGTYGGIAIMLVITAAIVFFLRALYGPKGRFRDPKWDESNRRIRQQEAERRERLLRKMLEEAEGKESQDGKGDAH